jgi:dTDP-4-dehydrorhamnose reductase
VLLTGASGLLGRQVHQRLQEGGWQVRGLCSTRCRPGLIKCDLTQAGEAEQQIAAFSPHVVVHMAAQRRPDVCHKKEHESHVLNVDATRALAEACKRHGVWLIYLSTDYVFDGNAPPYSVDAVPKPLGEYGEQKLEGEIVVRQECPSSVVLRVPLLYGQFEEYKESGVTALYPDLENGKMKKAEGMQKRYPTYTSDVAKIIQRMMDKYCAGKVLEGIYHWQADECFTKFQMVQLIAELKGLDSSGIIADTSAPKFPVPMDTRMDCSRLINDLNIDPRDFRTPMHEALQVCFRKYEAQMNACDDVPAAVLAIKTQLGNVSQQLPPAWSDVYKEEYRVINTKLGPEDAITFEDASNRNLPVAVQ